MDTTRPLGQLTPARAEDAYNLLAGYGFAQRYVEGKSVANIRWGEVGYGTRLLAETAELVVGLTCSPEALEQAQEIYPAPNVRYGRGNLPELPYPKEHFDVVIAFEVVENLEWPGDLVAEAKRVLKKDGVFLISTPDKQVYFNERNRKAPDHTWALYVSELREVLERHFGWVELYRQGAVAGSMIFKDAGRLSDTSVESTRFTLTAPSLGEDPPEADLVIAVCSDSEVPSRENMQSYLLLDQDRRLLDECEDHREDVELLRDEIRNMQETEVQAFQDAVKYHTSELAYLRAYASELRQQLDAIESYRIWPLLRLYLRLGTALGPLLKRVRRSGGA